jgi:hypothetical protein
MRELHAQSKRLRAALWVLVATTAASGWVACSSFQGVSDGPATTDAAGDSAADDAAALDAAALDAAVDAPPADSACSSTTTSVCDDFEGSWKPVWAKTIGAPGDLLLSTEQHVSPTHALLVTIGGDAGYGSAALRHDFPVVNTSGLACDFDLYPETLSAAGATVSSLLYFEMLPNADSPIDGLTGTVTIASNTSQLSSLGQAEGGYLYGASAIAAPLPLAAWSHFRFTVDFATREVALTRNGATYLVGTTASAFTKNNGVRLTLGVTGCDKPTKYFIDDVVCTAR